MTCRTTPKAAGGRCWRAATSDLIGHRRFDLPERQGLLDEPDALGRLGAERALLAREAAMLQATTSRPAPDLGYMPTTPTEPEAAPGRIAADGG